MATGKVISWKSDKGYGFIKPDEDGPDVFLHVAELGGISSSRIHRDVRVTYREGIGDRGPKACEVSLASDLPLYAEEPEPEPDLLTAEEFASELDVILDEANLKVRALAKRHGWIE